ncbi:furin-like protease kpc-1 isoform X2 [Mya arenaria]|uniref:furin-like protease kpc-1 isoform X2 n=1 Tax=Mya arenaria TaxID=6604 RepID=UPI0022E6E011|nr:furin-like protease kpc-1 isoform X2 [Mya arenaria]
MNKWFILISEIHVLLLIFIFVTNVKCDLRGSKRVKRQPEFSSTFLVEYDGDVKDVEEFAKTVGLKFVRKVVGRFYELQDANLPARTKAATQLDEKSLKAKHQKLKSIKQEEVRHMYKRSVVSGKRSVVSDNRSEVEDKWTVARLNRSVPIERSVASGSRPVVRGKRAVSINDPQWANQWHLNTGQSPNHDVKNAWDKGFDGSDVIIAIVDDGIETTHSDLNFNYDPTLSYDYINDVMDPSHRHYNEGHGTNCAGVAAAQKNSVCIIGTAYGAGIAAVRILDDVVGATSSQEARALVHKLDDVDIYSNSWGPSDDGDAFGSLPTVVEEALKTGVTEGRGGKGAVYVWASGNGGDNLDDCNADGYANSIYTIAINAVSESGAPTYYAEHCAPALAATYSGDDSGPRITTTGPSDSCVNDFSGTSAACPLAAGIIALLLQANPALTWRDVQHMIAEHSSSAGLSNGGFYSNGAGKQVSPYFGFGLLKAEALIDNAATWQSVPDSITCYQFSTNQINAVTSLSDSLSLTRCHISHVEHVTINIRYQSANRGTVDLVLTSPVWTQTQVMSGRNQDFSSEETTWRFMTVHLWGENPIGTWTLSLTDVYNYMYTMNLYSWELTVHGTVTDPALGAPTAGSLGGSCSDAVPCSGYTDAGCLQPSNVCVVCSSGFHVFSESCYEDGRLNGYCDSGEPCRSVDDSLECVDGRCQTKEGGLAALAILVCCVFFVKKHFCGKATSTVAPSHTHAGYRSRGEIWSSNSQPMSYPSSRMTYPTSYPTSGMSQTTSYPTSGMSQPTSYPSSGMSQPTSYPPSGMDYSTSYPPSGMDYSTSYAPSRMSQPPSYSRIGEYPMQHT